MKINELLQITGSSSYTVSGKCSECQATFSLKLVRREEQ